MNKSTLVILWLRSLGFRLSFWLLVAVYGLFSPLLMLIPLKYRYWYLLSWGASALWLLKAWCNLRYNIEGAEYLTTPSAIVLSKHSSSWETIALAYLLKVPATVSKKSLRKIPFFGWLLSITDPIFIDRKKSSGAMRELLTKSKVSLNQGRSILLFPEGTRVGLNEKGEYKTGGVLLAKKTGHPIVPIAHNAGEFWPKSATIIKPGYIKLVVGAPIDPKQEALKKLAQRVETWIEGHIESTTSSLNIK